MPVMLWRWVHASAALHGAHVASEATLGVSSTGAPMGDVPV